MFGGTYTYADGCLRRSKTLDPLKLELQAIVSCLLWVIGRELGFPARAVWALNSSCLGHLFSSETQYSPQNTCP